MPAGKIVNKRERVFNTYSFCVGINEFMDDRIADLEGCEQDAMDISAAFGANHKTILIGEEATRVNFLKKLEDLTIQIEKGALFILSISTHGSQLNDDLGICFYDSEQKYQIATTLSTSYLINILSPITDQGKKVLILLDICHAGTLSFDLAKYSGILSGGGMSAIYACGPNEQAFEYIFEGKHRGLFTKYLCDGLLDGPFLEGETNTNIATLRDLYDFVYHNVCQHNERQHPALIGTLKGNTILKRLDEKRKAKPPAKKLKLVR